MEDIKSFKRFVAFVVAFALFSQTVFASVFNVDHTGDSNDMTPGNGICATGGSFCTLRAAIQEANASAGTHTINIGSGIRTITASNGRYPTITRASTTINGAAASSSSGDIVVDGNGTGATTDNFFHITANTVSITDLVLYNTNAVGFKVNGASGVSLTRVTSGISAPLGSAGGVTLEKGFFIASSTNTTLRSVTAASADKSGIYIHSTTSTSIINSRVGTHYGGTATRANGYNGIEISGNTTGGTNVISGNVVSGNTKSGIAFSSTGTFGGTWWIHGNKIGVDSTGDRSPGDSGYVDMGNTLVGVHVKNSLNTLGLTIGNNRDGTNDSSEYNVISDNGSDGVNIRYAESAVISGNKIGTDKDGNEYIPNGIDGIFVNAVTTDIGTDNDLDATDAMEANVISGNAGWGIEVNGADTSTIKIRGNMIGANVSGTSTGETLTNASGAILVSASGANTVIIGAPVASGNNAPARNIIINNGGGIKITELASGPAVVKIQNNYIGVQGNGSVTAGNTGTAGFKDGIDFNLTTGWANLWIGLDTASTTKSNIIAANQKGIDIGNGVNTLFINGNYIGAILNAASAYIKDGGNLAHGIFISASNSDLNMVSIGSSTATFGNVISANNSGGLYVGNAGDASTPSQLYINNNSFGVGSDNTTTLSNTGAGVTIKGNVATITMTGNIVANSTGTGVDIRSGTALTFTGNLIGAAGLGTTAAGNGSYGLYLDASTLASVVIGGITAAVSNVFAGNVSDGIRIANLAGDNTAVTIKGNYLGVCAKISTGSISTTNLSQCKNSGVGIKAARGNLTIGGYNSIGAAGTGTIAEGNVIAGNATGGISIANNAVAGTGVRVATIIGNLIGVIRTTAAGVFNTANGNQSSLGSIVVNSSTINTLTIGDTGLTGYDKRNIISASTGTGGDAIHVADMSATGTSYIRNNYIGTDWTGATALANRLSGITIKDGSFDVGGVLSNMGNVISGNRVTGVFVSGSAVDGTNKIQGNTLGLNAAGTADLGNASGGISVQAVASGSTVQIGGTTTAARNIISGNDLLGIYDGASNAHTLNVWNNYVGLSAAGIHPLGNGSVGILISSTGASVNIGDSTGSASARNVISVNGTPANSGAGIRVHSANSLIVKGNYIGLGMNGTTLMANGATEIAIDQPSSVTTLTISSGNKINNTSHKGIDLNSVTATNEETMDSDNTWTDMVINSGDYKFWERSLADGNTLANWGPKDCYDGVDNDGDNLIDYSADSGCSSIRDDSEDPGLSSASAAAGSSSSSGNDADDVEDNDEDIGEEEEGDDDAADEEGDEEDTEPEPEPPLPPTPPQPEQPQPPTPPQPPVDSEDARDELLDAASVVVDTVSGARQAKAKIEDVITLIGEAEEEEEIVVEKTEEQILLDDTLMQVMAGEASKQDIEKFEAVAGELFGESVKEYLDKLESKGGEFAVTVGGRKRVINKNTKFEIELGSQKDASANQEASDDAGENKFVIGPSTILTEGVAEILKLQEGAPFDVEKPADKVFVLGLPGLSHPGKTIEDFLPEKAAVTSPVDGQEVSTEFLVWAVSPKKNDVLSFFLVDRVDPEDNTTWEMFDLGEVETGDDYKIAAVMDLTDHDLQLSEKKEFDLVILNEDGEGSSVKIVVNPELEFQASEVKLSRGEVIELGQPEDFEDEREDISDILHTSVLLASAKVVEENTDANIVRQEPVRKLTGYIDTPGAIVFVTWRSVILNSVVVADASQGYFEVDMPEELARGDHEVLVYAYNKKKNWTSNIRTLLFNR